MQSHSEAAAAADLAFLREANALSEESVAKGTGPFGAVVVDASGKVIGRAHNQVVAIPDPTAHGEVQAIRDACRNVGTHDLSGCTIYTSCEPCPMCLCAIYWARIGRIVYGNTAEDAAAVGFDDAKFYEQLRLPKEARAVPAVRIEGSGADRAFAMWQSKTGKVDY